MPTGGHAECLAGSRSFVFTAPLTASSSIPVSTLPSGLHRLSISCDARTSCVIHPYDVIILDKPGHSSQDENFCGAEDACSPAGACMAISAGDVEHKVQLLGVTLRAAYASHSWPMLPHLEAVFGSSDPLVFFGFMAVLAAGSRAAWRISKVAHCWYSRRS